MDPNEALRQIRWRLDEAENGENVTAELAELITGLDTWLTKGGFLPTAWQRNTIQPQIVELAGPPLSQFADEVAKVFGLAPAVRTLRFSVATIDGKPSVAWKVNEGMWSRYRPTTVTVDHS